MTNEDKIFDILATIVTRLDSVDSRLDSLDSRLDSVDSRLDSVDSRLDSLENEVLKTNIKLEGVIEPKLAALGEGHAAILEQLVPCSRVDDLESRVKFLESMLRQAFDELEKLKIAQ